MKKILLTIALALLLISCGSKDDGKTLYLYGWADYIPHEIYEDFERETGIHVVEDIFSSNEEMYTKLKAGGDGYDIVMPSSDYVEIMMKEGMIEKLDKTKISTLGNIAPFIMKKLQTFDTNNDYAVPYNTSVTVIAVNKMFVKDYPKSFDIYNRKDLQGRMTLLDDMRELMTSALAIHGYDQKTSSIEAMEKAKQTILAWKKNIAKFDSESYGKGFAAGDFWVVQGYPDNIFRELSEEEREHVELIIPEKGAFGAIDSFTILANAKHKENAYKFIEYIHRPEVYAKLSDILELPSINEPAAKLMTVKPLYDLSELEKIQVLMDIHETLDLQNKYWQEILIAD
ncbi:spermidine/putrescine ABC transporter substrate-binding protein [Fusobacterium necrophorum BFTR-2]|uniref:Spermidine/putrescine ABC transporter substrate-binding protein n=1 Tax=Fusobacterium necrophorum BL TaxID=1441732 RepID=A0AB73BXX8_9FUSO|nr:extracellular solute-binding protein [Fusobacterium necrophorum]KDE64517.1 spermidine/putrescine ABC transporter substrate-binding protein [Fusobacterium necrophorum BL]KDE70703.1 spermidine/putrescine ABC transporter substrate-binding protein [Fusobacterium necrophorum BFTR-2]